MEPIHFKQSLFTLHFLDDDLEEEYRLKAFPNSLKSFKVVFLFLLALDLYIIVVEFFRMDDPFYAVFTRSLMLIFYSAVILISNFLGKVGPKYHQSFVFLALLAMYLIVLTQDIYGDMYYLFFSNVAFTLIYIVFTVSGLRFTNALILALLYLAIYVFYCFWWYPNAYHAGQLPNVMINWVIAAMAGYILEKSSRKAFANGYLLKQKNIESERYNALKNKLLSVVSHDVQSPLNSINSVLSMFKEKAISPADSTKLLHKIHEQVAGTIGYVQKILFWTKNQMNGFQINKQSINLHAEISKCVKGFESLAEEKNIRIDNHVEHNNEIFADPEMFDIVLRNLLGNAIKFSPEHTAVEISFHSNEQWDELAIRDHGVGIEQDRLEKIFAFNHAHTDGTKLERGSGIGLSLCSEFMTKLEGGLSVESQVGEGSTFYLKFKKSI
ncbi:MAG: HAMP domain-containing sensor histidine kinase [Reichenbachiella sp.]|uniref:sensor histidine kinase n=1 Tax=Reichenbachiella sp. TaxID=2184521 RepID=UPI002966F30E|nr:HAMP domain-containing sensor histidine kinase [Reichenbachiella sp.]MDW3208551.1 HAMP domain-containing sensor histidine kinase [Reichenbachiella sp.]